MNTLTRKEPANLRSLFPRFPFGLFRDEVDNAFSHLGDWEGQWATQMLNPSLDVAESENSIDVTMDIPGMKAENIDIEVVSNILTISGERSEQKEEKKGNGKAFHRVERHMGQFSRSISLPCAVDQSHVEATYDNGVLKVRLPKAEETKARKFKVMDKQEVEHKSESAPVTNPVTE
ncbi:MAG: hspA 4 [Planctomycetaceae bacterium]|nr:hspA 4 [Planctomycetaceae bacterium]